MDSAIAYLQALGADPYEMVAGYLSVGTENHWISRPRWQWYVGASPALAEGADRLSPRQFHMFRQAP